MKKNKFNIKVRTVNIVLIALCVFVFTSCLKDDTAPNYSHSPALVGFQYTGFSATPFTAGILGTPEDTLGINVTLSVASLTLKSPVTLTIAPSPSSLDSFNIKNGDSAIQLDPSLYTLANGGKVAINPGQQMVNFRINFAGDKIDFNKHNGLGLKITDAQGAIIASNLNTAIILIKLKSKYAGNYHVFGARIHPTAGTFPFDYNINLNTVNANTIDGNVLADLGEGLAITINPDNSVTLVGELRDVFLQSGKENKYDPATKTITLNYYYNSAAPRLIHETLVLN